MKGEPFVFACHRSSVPGASASWDDSGSFAIYADNASISLEPCTENAVHRVLWPETESPRTIISEKDWGEAYYGKMRKRRIFEAWLFFGDAKQPAWKSMLDHAWKRNYKPGKPEYSENLIWDLSIQYTKKLYAEENGFCGFSIGFCLDREKKNWTRARGFEAGWCGLHFSVSGWLVAWPCAFRLEVLRNRLDRE
ncbi:MAG: hypothetical protein LBF95_07735 [Treponema sp.]|jgi:hypothetical protein|nr:hypothetical protein [Treponema sp.]